MTGFKTETSGTFSPWEEELSDKREFKEISAADGYWKDFWVWKCGPKKNNNVVNIKEATYG